MKFRKETKCWHSAGIVLAGHWQGTGKAMCRNSPEPAGRMPVTGALDWVILGHTGGKQVLRVLLGVLLGVGYTGYIGNEKNGNGNGRQRHRRKGSVSDLLAQRAPGYAAPGYAMPGCSFVLCVGEGPCEALWLHTVWSSV